MAIYMQYGGIEGDATQQGYANWINLVSVDWNVAWAIGTRAGIKGKLRDGLHAVVDEVTVTKETDSASPLLLNAVANSNDPVECIIEFVRAGDPGEWFVSYLFKNALITSWQTQSSNERPGGTETIKINFTEMEMRIQHIDKSNMNIPTTPMPIRVTKVDEARPEAPGTPGKHGGR